MELQRHYPVGGRATFEVPIGLATVAALTPSDWQIRIVDENIEAIDFDVGTDVVGISLFNVQFRRAVEIAAEFRRRGPGWWPVAPTPRSARTRARRTSMRSSRARPS